MDAEITESSHLRIIFHKYLVNIAQDKTKASKKEKC